MRREEERRKKREAQLERRKRDALCQEEHLEIFTTWWVFGGREHGISPMDAAEMPATMRKDFMLILQRIGEERDWRETQTEKPTEKSSWM